MTTQAISEGRFLGCLFGQAVGDALGAPFEGLPADFIYWIEGPVHELLAQPTAKLLRYTDYTQMMIGVAETLVAHGEIRQLAEKLHVRHLDEIERSERCH